jgi:hypothetical protein
VPQDNAALHNISRHHPGDAEDQEGNQEKCGNEEQDSFQGVMEHIHPLPLRHPGFFKEVILIAVEINFFGKNPRLEGPKPIYCQKGYMDPLFEDNRQIWAFSILISHY